MAHKPLEAGGHCGLGAGEHGASLARELEADRPLVVGDLVACQQALCDQRRDCSTDGGLAEREPLRQPGRPLVATGDESEEAVVGETELPSGPVENTCEPSDPEYGQFGARKRCEWLSAMHADDVSEMVRLSNHPLTVGQSGRGRGGAGRSLRRRTRKEPPAWDGSFRPVAITTGGLTISVVPAGNGCYYPMLPKAAPVGRAP